MADWLPRASDFFAARHSDDSAASWLQIMVLGGIMEAVRLFSVMKLTTETALWIIISSSQCDLILGRMNFPRNEGRIGAPVCSRARWLWFGVHSIPFHSVRWSIPLHSIPFSFHSLPFHHCALRMDSTPDYLSITARIYCAV